jgi:hypothetical protein
MTLDDIQQTLAQEEEVVPLHQAQEALNVATAERTWDECPDTAG